MSYLIFIDTNVVYNDFFFKSNAMKKLLKFTRHEPVNLCITKFNYYEIIKKYRDNVRPILKKVREVKKDISKDMEKLKVSNLFDIGNLKAEKYVDQYRVFIEEFIDRNRIQLVDYPSGKFVTKEISEKYFSEMKPFEENKESFQDAIIWESIVEYCNNEKPKNVVFISNNTKDFANKEKNKIHKHLEKDIEGLIFYKSIGEFIEHEEDNLKDYFVDNYKYDTKLLIEKLEYYFDGNSTLNYTIHDLLINSEFQGEYISGWGNHSDINSKEFSIDEVTLDIEENKLLISFIVKLDVSFNIETINPNYERGDYGDGLLTEHDNTRIYMQGDISYSIEREEMNDYVEIDIDFL